jgi:hypothetical protein
VGPPNAPLASLTFIYFVIFNLVIGFNRAHLQPWFAPGRSIATRMSSLRRSALAARARGSPGSPDPVDHLFRATASAVCNSSLVCRGNRHSLSRKVGYKPLCSLRGVFGHVSLIPSDSSISSKSFRVIVAARLFHAEYFRNQIIGQNQLASDNQSNCNLMVTVSCLHLISTSLPSILRKCL